MLSAVAVGCGSQLLCVHFTVFLTPLSPPCLSWFIFPLEPFCFSVVQRAPLGKQLQAPGCCTSLINLWPAFLFFPVWVMNVLGIFVDLVASPSSSLQNSS